MHKMKSFADAMAVAGAPISDDELVDYIITGLGKAYNPLAENLTLANRSVPYAEFYSAMLSFESLQASQGQDAEWSSSANAATRPTSVADRPMQLSGGPYVPSYGHQSQGHNGGNGGGNYYRPDNGRNGGGRGGGNGGGCNGSGGNGRNGGGNGGNGRRNRPRCQLCGYWGHAAADCRNCFDRDYRGNNSRAGNSASTSNNNNNPHWYMDTGATDHLTSDLERLHMHERYGGTDQVQVANGMGLSISHIGHSNLAGSSLKLKNILHVPRISQHLLSVSRLVADNYVFVEFHRNFFLVKDKATRRILLHDRSKGGLYPVPLAHVSSTSSRCASASVKVTASRWHQRLGHPTNNVVKDIVGSNKLVCSLDSTSSVCDACQRAKSRQLPYTSSSRVSTMPLELVHSDVWGPACASSGGTSIMLALSMIILAFAGSILSKINLMLSRCFMLFRPM
jgi:histone deacetylase 1/2